MHRSQWHSFCLSGLLTLAVFVSASHTMAQHGLSSRPAVGPYYDGVFPPELPSLGNWSVVEAYPSLSFQNPLGVTEMPGGISSVRKMVVWEREGKVYHFDHASTATTKTLVLDVSDRCQGWDDSGLLGLAFHPNFAVNRQVFIWYTYTALGTVQGSETVRPPTYKSCRDRLSRFTLDVNGVAGAETVLLEQNAVSVWHNGGGMFFHPMNGHLYITNGDDATTSNTQRINGGLFSGVLRIDVDKRGGLISHAPVHVPTNVTVQDYFIPNDNPFVGQAGINEEFFAIGLRSPHRMTLDADSGRIFIGDVGAGDREEVSIIEPTDAPGQNMQWDRIEGYNGDLTPPYIGVNKRPALDYTHSEGNAVIGGYVYRPKAALPGARRFDELIGRYIFADNGTGNLYILNEGTAPATKTLLGTVPNGSGASSGSNYVGVSSFGEDVDGDLYICRMSTPLGKIFKLQRGGAASTPLPATLSATGLFTDLPGFVVNPKMIPYALNAPFWSDKAIKSRWVTVPNNSGQTVGFSPTGEFVWPEGTLTLKHFDYSTSDVTPSLTRRLETRVLLKKSDGSTYGATYKWRADNSDADLLPDALNEWFPVAIPDVGAFTGANLGTPAQSGSVSRTGSTVTITAGGSDIQGTADEGYYASQQRTGDFDLSVKVESLTQNDLYTKAGLMVRESLAANSRHLMAMLFPSNAARNNNNGGYEFQYRETTGGGTSVIYPTFPQPTVSYPNAWLRIRRTGNLFIAYSSSNGAEWRENARLALPLPSTVYFGFSMTSHNTAQLGTCQFQVQTTRQQQWYYPSRAECIQCHNTNAGGILGPKTRQINKVLAYPSNGVGDGSTANQLHAWNNIGLFHRNVNDAEIATLPKMSHYTETSESLEQRGRSYLDTNCASCHRPGGVHAFWDARYDTPLASQGIIYGRVGTDLGIANARVVVPQDLVKSMIHVRTNRIGLHQMPPIARNLIDEQGVALLEQWIGDMPLNTPPVVTIDSPLANANIVIPATVTITATATDTDGIAKVEFYAGSEKIGEDTAAPFTFTWTDAPLGTHQLRVSAIDNSNNFSDSAIVPITVSAPKGLFAARINFQPALAPVPSGYLVDDGSVYADLGYGLTYGWTRDNRPDARDRNSHPDQRYDTFIHMQKDQGGGSTTSSWAIAVPNSTYSVTVLAGDAINADSVHELRVENTTIITGTPAGQFFYEGSATVTVTDNVLNISPGPGAVNAKIAYTIIEEVPPLGNLVPLATITSPADGAEFATGQSITFSATASDPDGSVAKVEFYADGVKLGEDTGAPFTYFWASPAGGSHIITARAVDNLGVGAFSDPISIISLPVNGLVAEYFDNDNFTNRKVKRIDRFVDFNYGAGSPAPSIANDSFSARWRGRVRSGFTGLHTFATRSDDGARVWVDGQLVVNGWFPQAVTRHQGTVMLNANEFYEIIVEYYDGAFDGSMQLLWSGPGFDERIIPEANLFTPATSVAPTISLTTPPDRAVYTSVQPITICAAATDPDTPVTRVEFFFNDVSAGVDSTAPFTMEVLPVGFGAHRVYARVTTADGQYAWTSAHNFGILNGAAASGLIAEYFDNEDFTNIKVVRYDFDINFFWPNGQPNGVGSPDASIDTETFSARWRGRIRSANAGLYTFKATADDRVRVRVNGTQIIDRWFYDGPPVTGTITLAASTWYDIEVEFVDDAFDGRMQLFWSGPGITGEPVAPRLSAGDFTSVFTPPTGIFAQPPTVMLSAPVNNSNVIEGDTVTLTADANDVDGTILKVNFYSGSTLIAEDSAAPFTWPLGALTSGSYTFNAKATDSQGLSASSADAGVTVVPLRMNMGSNPLYPSRMSFTLPNGRTWVLEKSATLAPLSWTTVISGTSNGSVVEQDMPDLPFEPRMFYRVRVTN
ncbi:MAG: Ig-like domain-containing protein [Prosthecobacter sp.]